MNSELENIDPARRIELGRAMDELKPELTTEQVLADLELSQKGYVKGNLSNCVKVLRSDPVLKGAICYNLLTQQTDLIRELGWPRESSRPAMTDIDIENIRLYIEQTYGITSEKNIESAITIVANENRYHPIRDYLNSLQWDGQERVRYALRHFLGADTSDYTYEMLKFFMLGAVSRVYEPGIKFDYMLCLIGSQGTGKSSFFNFLAVRDEWFTDDIKDLESEKVFQKMQGHWIIEMSEMLATTNAKSNESVKSFLSRRSDNFRTPYDKFAKDRPRQCVFGGTTNKTGFLPRDRTGNRRFLPVRCHEELAEVFILDDEAVSRAYIDQMWAEIMEIYRKGNIRLKLTKEMSQAVVEYQRQFTQEDVDSGMIQAFMEDYTGDKVCSRMLFKEALNHPYDEPRRYQTNEICETVNQLITDGTLKGWEYFASPKRFTDYGTQKGWMRVNAAASTEGGFEPVPEQLKLPFDEPKKNTAC